MRIRWGTPKYRVEIERKHSAGAAWFWRIVTTVNGQTKTLATSVPDTYSSRAECERDAANVADEAGWDWGITVKVIAVED